VYGEVLSYLLEGYGKRISFIPTSQSFRLDVVIICTEPCSVATANIGVRPLFAPNGKC
jgi:hypothetical protein